MKTTMFSIGAARLAGLVLSLALSHQTAAQQVLVRPYVQPGPTASADGPDSKAILWFTDAAGGEFSIEYGWASGPSRTAAIGRTDIVIPAPTAEQIRKNAPKAEKPTAGDAAKDAAASPLPLGDREQRYVKYAATLADLPRNSTVWYRVKSGAEVVGEASFKTRATADEPIRFVAVGDLAKGKADQDAVAYQASLAKPDFLLALGDITYPTGRVSQYMDHFWRTYRNVDTAGPTSGAPLMASVPFYALIGNHDADTSLNLAPDCLGIYYFFRAPLTGPGRGRWNTPISRDKTQSARFQAAVGDSYPALGFYSFDEGPAHFVVLDSNGYVNLETPELLKWIETDLAASKAKWKFVCMHAPAFHSSPAHYTEQKLRRLSPLLEKAGVDVVFSGHIHNYQRSHPLRFQPAPPQPGNRLVDGKFIIDTTFDGVHRTRANGIIHIVSGGGGGTLYKDPVTRTAEFMNEKYPGNWARYTAKHIVDRHSFVVCDLEPAKLTLRAVDAAGQEMDRIVVTKD